MYFFVKSSFELLFEDMLNIGFPMYQKDGSYILNFCRPIYQLFLVRMGREAIDSVDFCFDSDFLSIDLYKLCTIHYFPSQGAFSLISYDNDTVFFFFFSVFEMVQYPATITHAASSYDNVASFFGVYSF